ncbi:hypothetical protein THAOC_08401 [Thalassiosira oceanica]|uniref:Uncharacterized protein n=1 Tax=Thalassiosira oceanica TaxID=159749 RepID=K0SZ49_THAOC|nr:hypothetical protein THAOC_08401 [Thalassiosira oceanica]|eukprot:EJK70254.1 hypothetical protein THAOC_08401 [Thalassiosira oceanica]
MEEPTIRDAVCKDFTITDGQESLYLATIRLMAIFITTRGALVRQTSTVKLLSQNAEGYALCNSVTLDDANPNLEGCEATVKSSSNAKGLVFGSAMAAIATMFQISFVL